MGHIRLILVIALTEEVIILMLYVGKDNMVSNRTQVLIMEKKTLLLKKSLAQKRRSLLQKRRSLSQKRRSL